MDRKNRMWRTLELVNFSLDIFVVFFLIAGPWVVAPALLQVFGRAHPLVLHFPIVLVVILPLLPLVLSGISATNDQKTHFTGRFLEVTHFFCALTVLFGLILSLEEGYSGDQINFHKWGGIIVLLCIILLQNNRIRRIRQRKQAALLLAVPVLALVITSHIGAGITHGQGFLTQPIAEKYKKKVPLDQAFVFRDVIHPILDQKCMNCHNTAKSRGELSLEDSISIFRGGESGAVLMAGNPGESALFQRLILDIDHEDHMPPKGKPQLSQQEISLIRAWIARPHLFDLAYHSLDPSDTLSLLIRESYDTGNASRYDMKPAPKSTIQELNDNYRTLNPIAVESPALYARFLSTSHFQDEHLESLTRVKEQVVDLYLGYMPVTDHLMPVIGNLVNLQVLNLNGTQITDEGLKHLHQLNDLQKLYLTETGITAGGIHKLLEQNPVKRIYVWKTSLDSVSISELNNNFPGTIILGVSDAFGNEIIGLNPPQINPESPFFQSSMNVFLDHPVPQVDIRYTTDGSDPDSLHAKKFEGPLEIAGDLHLKAKAYKSGWISSPVLKKSFIMTKHTPDSLWFDTEPNPRFTGEGPSTLINLQAGEKVHEDKNYLAYRDKKASIGFAFAETTLIRKVVVSGLTKTPSYIFPPTSVVLETWDGSKWNPIQVHHPEMPEMEIDYEKYYISLEFDEPVHTHRLRLHLTPLNRLPSWHPGKGSQGWVFIDEVLFQ